VALADIDTIVIVIMENRSFDHMMGYLSLGGVKAVEGGNHVLPRPRRIGTTPGLSLRAPELVG
jgi:phospholipase C